MFRKAAVLTVFFFLCGCNLFASEPEPGVPTYYTQSVNDYLQKANEASTPSEKAYYQIEAAGRALADGQTDAAKQYLAATDTIPLSLKQRQEKAILQAKIAMNEGDNQQALQDLSTVGNPATLSPELERAYYQSASIAHQNSGQTVAYCQDLIQLSALLPTDQAATERSSTLSCLQSLSNDTLNYMANMNNTSEVNGWIAIAQLSKNNSSDSPNFQQGYQQWTQRYPNHPAAILFTASTTAAAENTYSTKDVGNVDASHIALLLPLNSAAGKAVRDGFMAAYYSHPSGHTVKLYDTSGQDINSVYARALNEGATLVVGPLTKPEVSRLQSSGQVSVPTLALNNISTSGSHSDFYQFALSPNDEAEQAARRAYASGYHTAMVIAPSDSWGQGIVNTFATQFSHLGGQVRESVAYGNNTVALNDLIRNGLQAKIPNSRNANTNAPNRRQDIDMIFLVATPEKAREIKPLLNFYYADAIPVYATSIIYNGVNDPFKNQDLNGVEFCTLPWYVSHSSQVALAKANMGSASATTTGLYAFGYDAYNMATNLNQLSNGFSGVTGELYLKPNQQVYREVVWAKFNNGEARLI